MNTYHSCIMKFPRLLIAAVMVAAAETTKAKLPEVGPDYAAPTNSAPAAYKAGELGNWSQGKLPAKVETQSWWEIYQDAVLNDLEAKVLKQNQQLKAAYARLDQARATARVNRSFLLPTVDANGYWSRTHTALHEIPGPGDANFTQMGTPLDLSYEVDLWGRVRRSFESARADAQASDADYYGLRLTQLADLAEDYFTLRSLDDQIARQNQIVQLRSSQLELGTKLREHGLEGEGDLNMQKVQLDSASTQLAGLKLHRDQIENGIAVLAGENPATFHVVAQAGTECMPLLPQVPAGLPSELLERRPDISAAERELASANARIGVAKAAFFPVVTLTGSGGYVSADVESLFNWSGRAWSIGPSVSLPIFAGGKNRANLARAKAAYAEAVAKYRDHVLTAFSEVENSFVAIQRISQQQASAQKSTDELNDNLKLARQRRASGLADDAEVFDSEQAFFNSNEQLAEFKAQHLIATVEALKALGGGWNAKSEFGQ